MLNICSHVFERVLEFSADVLKHHPHPREQCGAGWGQCCGGVWPNPQLVLKWFCQFWAHCYCRAAWVYSGVFGTAVADWNSGSGDVSGNAQNQRNGRGISSSLSCVGTGRFEEQSTRPLLPAHSVFPNLSVMDLSPLP